ncbi:hypothetical protein SRIMM317S_00854 [Streptomyces rimosus subsp. rimosus]
MHAVSSYLFMTGCNIEDSQQFGDHDTGLFFMRVHFSADATVSVENFARQASPRSATPSRWTGRSTGPTRRCASC